MKIAYKHTLLNPPK